MRKDYIFDDAQWLEEGKGRGQKVVGEIMERMGNAGKVNGVKGGEGVGG